MPPGVSLAPPVKPPAKSSYLSSLSQLASNLHRFSIPSLSIRRSTPNVTYIDGRALLDVRDQTSLLDGIALMYSDHSFLTSTAAVEVSPLTV